MRFTHFLNMTKIPSLKITTLYHLPPHQRRKSSLKNWLVSGKSPVLEGLPKNWLVKEGLPEKLTASKSVDNNRRLRWWPKMVSGGEEDGNR